MLRVGEVITFERQFTKRDVERFTEISQDEGKHHISEDNQGRLVVQGLLTATLPTKIGGDHDVLASTMNFNFLRPVYTGDTITCMVKIERYERVKTNRMAIRATFTCDNQHSKTVLTGEFSGVVLE